MKKIFRNGEWHKVHLAYYKKYGLEKEPSEPEGVNLKKVGKLLKKLKSNRHNIFTFSTEYMPFQLKKLRTLLIEDNFIFADITENQFCHIFTEQLVTEKTKRIRWKTSKEALRYFLKYLIPSIGTLHKNQVANCFSDKDGKPFEISKPNKKKPIRKAIEARIKDIVHNI